VCDRFEIYLRQGNTIAALESSDKLRAGLVDFIELTIYAAAEHVDDIESIATGFFRDRQQERNAAFKLLQKDLKEIKRFVAVVANVIKHQQARIRTLTVEMTHAGIDCCLHGCFVEGVEAGVVSPRKILDATQECFSIPTLLWEIVTFVLRASSVLRSFLDTVFGSVSLESPAIETHMFAKAIAVAARLPIYTFGEAHPFTRASLLISGSAGGAELMDSGLYGSIRRPWKLHATPAFGRFQGFWEGDGVTRSFRLPKIREVGLTQWR
jgi:hypothetical protein